MDSDLRAYLEQPPPRPRSDARFDERNLAWRLPLGAAITGALLVTQMLPDSLGGVWIYRGVAWASLVLVAYGVERYASERRQRLLRTGAFGSARLVSQEVKREDEDLLVIVIVEVRSGGDSEAYRAAPLASRYQATLGDRWLVEQRAPFAADSTFPILIGVGARHDVLLFINDETIEVARIK